MRGAAFGQTGQPDTGQLLARPALPNLVELVVVDEPTSMAYVLRAAGRRVGHRAG